jgi:hypothetical protein
MFLTIKWGLAKIIFKIFPEFQPNLLAILKKKKE